MATLKIEIAEEKDLSTVEAFLRKMHIKYSVEDEELDDLPEEAIVGINAGLDDIKAGRVYTHEQVVAHLANRMNELRRNG